MISILGSLSFAKLVMSRLPLRNLQGMPDTRPKIHSFVYCLIQSRLQSGLQVRSFYVERNNLIKFCSTLYFIDFMILELFWRFCYTIAIFMGFSGSVIWLF